MTIGWTILVLFSCHGTHGESENNQKQEVTGTFDPELAAKYGADSYGMKKYIVAFLYRGDNAEADSVRRASLQMEHLRNITRLAEEGKLVLAGPFLGKDELRGIYIFNVESIEEARALTSSDPSIQAGILRMELKEWYGSAGLMALNEISERITEKKIIE